MGRFERLEEDPQRAGTESYPAVIAGLHAWREPLVR